MPKRLWFDRTASTGLMEVLRDGRPRQLVELAIADREREPLFDLQLRRETTGRNPKSWATLYYGLTSVLDLEERGGLVRLKAHKTHQKGGQFAPAWNEWQKRAELDKAWPEVASYLERVVTTVDKRWTDKEGGVHAALSSGASDAYRVINREVSPGFVDQATKDRLMAEWWAPIEESLDAGANGEAWWPANVKVGASPDFLAVDIGGRLAVAEAKHHSATGMIAKVPLQVGFYARMFSELMREDGSALESMEAMLRQRVELGLSRPGVLYLTRRRKVVPSWPSGRAVRRRQDGNASGKSPDRPHKPWTAALTPSNSGTSTVKDASPRSSGRGISPDMRCGK